jgi:hypothetical protein
MALTGVLDQPIACKVIADGTTTQFTVLKFVDDTVAKRVTATYKLGALPHRDVILWEGAAYVATGQYTDSDVVARVKELISGA